MHPVPTSHLDHNLFPLLLQLCAAICSGTAPHSSLISLSLISPQGLSRLCDWCLGSLISFCARAYLEMWQANITLQDATPIQWGQELVGKCSSPPPPFFRLAIVRHNPQSSEGSWRIQSRLPTRVVTRKKRLPWTGPLPFHSPTPVPLSQALLLGAPQLT